MATRLLRKRRYLANLNCRECYSLWLLGGPRGSTTMQRFSIDVQGGVV